MNFPMHAYLSLESFPTADLLMAQKECVIGLKKPIVQFDRRLGGASGCVTTSHQWRALLPPRTIPCAILIFSWDSSCLSEQQNIINRYHTYMYMIIQASSKHFTQVKVCFLNENHINMKHMSASLLLLLFIYLFDQNSAH